MIYSVRGELIHKDESCAVIECAGVGYACRTTLATLSKLGSIGSEERLYTYLSIREDGAELFGFASLKELDCFKLLISVSGVGPKAALSILSDIPADKFPVIVASGDSKAFTKVKGIGAKTAQRIVLELKDKIEKSALVSSEMSENTSFSAPDFNENSSISEAVSALTVLGYSNSEIMPVLSGLDSSLSASELIKQALKAIASSKFK
ncbi:MAG: Holliday junction branch migration protein RuvA [Oscillospiraceae bacterium]